LIAHHRQRGAQPRRIERTAGELAAVFLEGLAEPVSVTQVGNTGWVAEGKLSYIIGDNKGKDPGPFVIKPVSLSK